MSGFFVILVHSTSHALRAESVLKRAGVTAKLIPTPRHLSSDCGSAVRVAAGDRVRCEEILRAANVPIDRVAELEV